jgi:hypothetical protein
VNSDRPQLNRSSWIWLLLLCLYALLHSLAYALTNPVFESPDEPGHLEYINRIASGGGMPNQYDEKQFLPEGHQGPLYYVALGELLRLGGGPISVSLPPSTLPDHWFEFDHRGPAFKTSRDRRIFYGLRLFGCVLVGLTTLMTGLAARKVMPIGHVWLVAPLLAAMLPELAFIGSSISNDGTVALCCACATFAAASCSAEPGRGKHWLALGIWTGLAFLSKKNAIVYVPAGLVLVVGIWLSRAVSSKEMLRNGLIACGAGLLLYFPILLRNQLLYGELLGNRMEMDTLPSLVFPQSLSSRHFRVIFPDMVPRSFLAHFGWMSVEVRQVYVWPLVRAILGAAGLGGLALFDRKRAAFAAFCFTAFLGNVVGLVYYNLIYPQAQGRLLFPGLAPLALLCALGLFEVSDRIRFRYKSLALAPLVLWLVWFDLLAFWTNQNFYAWFGPKLGF